MNTLTPQKLDEKIKGNDEVFILDVRSQDKYESNHIKGDNIKSLNILKTHIFNLADDIQSEIISDIPKNKEVIVTCTTGNSARKCTEILKEKGYNVTLLEGGVTAWEAYIQSR